MNSLKIYTDLSQVTYQKRLLVLGNFDGIHKGHRALLEKGYEISKKENLIFTVFTFFPQIQSTIDENFKYLISQEKKIDFLKQYLVDEVITLPFEDNLSKMTSDDFIKKILVKIGTQKIVIGYNFSFGYRGLGSFVDLKNAFNSQNVYVVSPVKRHDEIISSSKIRELLIEGNLNKANEMLGYPFTLTGKVVHGYKNGRKFGFPTANILTNRLCIQPKSGVYIASIKINGFSRNYLGVVSIGPRPTIDNKEEITIEAHLINFAGNLYDSELTIQLHHYIREIKKFDSIVELKEQIIKDVELALKYEITS